MKDQLIVKHCAPTLAGLKTGSLFTAHFDSPEQMALQLRDLNRLLTKKGLRATPLRQNRRSYLIYLYRPDRLRHDLQTPEASAILEEQGYLWERVEQCLAQLARRMREGKKFPHEVGLFLGYPPADVRCFMEDTHRGVRCTGHWKVYSNMEEAERTFAKYRKCTRVYREALERGSTLEKLIVHSQRRTPVYAGTSPI